MNSLTFFWNKDIYAKNKTSKLFIRAMKENIAFHRLHCPKYKKILDKQGFNESLLHNEASLALIPPLPTLYFKRNRLFSLPEKKLRIKATSSGTGGIKSQLGFDDKSFYYGMQMVCRFFSYHKLLSLKPSHCIILGFEPNAKNSVAAAKTAYGASFFSPVLSHTYALRYKDGSYTVNIEGIIKALKKCSKSPFPVRFMGFPSYMYFLLEKLLQYKIKLKFPKGSKVMLGGGWKQFGDIEVSRDRLNYLIKDRLGIDRENVYEFFSVAEHPVPYIKCKNEHFHIPIYSRVIIRDINTLKPLPYGKVGILNLLTPYVKSMPLSSVLTDDLAVLHPAKSCGCGIATDYFELKGRAGVSQIKTCAAHAIDFGEKV